MDLDPLEFRTQKAQEAILELRDLVREAHGAMKDIRQIRKDIDAYISPGIDERLEAEVKKQIGRLGSSTDKAITNATNAVFKRFDKLAALIMGEDEPGKPTIEALVKQKMELENHANATTFGNTENAKGPSRHAPPAS